MYKRQVYQSLEEDGYIVSKRRLGAFVADVSDKPGVSAEVTAEIVNRGYLPTWISRQRQAMKLTEPVQIELTGAEILQGQAQG